MRATAPIRTIGSNNCFISHLTKTDDGKSDITRHKWCWFCKNSAHWPDQCEKIKALKPKKRLNVAKENHVCFSCLKRAGRDHRMSNCNRRRQCTIVENGKQCPSFHHPLLHQSTKANVGIAVANENQESLLPTISDDICAWYKQDVQFSR
jgi:hypothetical protein